MKNSQFLKNSKVAYLGGDDTWYASDVQDYTTPDGPITLSGKLVDILHVATMLSLSIVPEAQNMTKYDGSGIATVTLSPGRMDINIAGGGGGTSLTEATVEVTNTLDDTIVVTWCSIMEDNAIAPHAHLFPTSETDTAISFIGGYFIALDPMQYMPVAAANYTGMTELSSGIYLITDSECSIEYSK